MRLIHDITSIIRAFKRALVLGIREAQEQDRAIRGIRSMRLVSDDNADTIRRAREICGKPDPFDDTWIAENVRFGGASTDPPERFTGLDPMYWVERRKRELGGDRHELREAWAPGGEGMP